MFSWLFMVFARTQVVMTQLDRARVVMTQLDQMAVEHNAFPTGIDDFSKLNATEAVNIFDHILLICICYEGGRTPHKRPNDLTLNTIAEKIYKLKRQRVAN